MFQVSEVLKKVPFFRTLGKDGIDFIVERLKFKPFDANQTICKVGDPGDKMYIIINGKVKVLVSDEQGNETVIAELGSGDYFGEMSLLTGEPRSATIVTTEPSEMFILNKNDFDLIVERFPSISLSMGKIMSQRLRETLKKAARSGSAKAAPAVKGNLAEKSLVDVLKFCEANSLNGKVIVKKGNEVGEFYYEKGELQQVKLGNYTEAEALDLMLNWTEGEFIIETRPLTMESTAPVQKPDESIPSLIIVNNSMVVQKMLQRAFESMGYEVYAVETIAKGSKLINTLNPQLVIADVKLPDGASTDFIHSIREKSQVPVVLLTDESNKQEFSEKLNSVPNVYFTNNPEIGEILKIVESIIKA